MKRAILVTTSTVVGVAAVLGYKPNSDTAQTLLDITGANNTASTTQTTPTESAAATPATEPTQAAAEPSAATAAPQASAAATSTAKATAKPTPKATASPKATERSAATTTTPAAPTPSATATPTPTATKTAGGASKTVTGDAARAISHGHDYGTVSVTVTLVDGKMTKISATQNPEGRNYPYIQAVRQYLIPAVLDAQKANVGYVQGATGSSEAFIASLQSALGKA